MEYPHASLVLGMWSELAVRVLRVACGTGDGASMVDESSGSGGFLYAPAVVCVVRCILAGVRVPGNGMAI